MAWLTQCSGDGQAIGKPVGSPGRTLTTSQKQLRDENGKSCHGRLYKRPQTCIVKRNKNREGKGTTMEMKEIKENKETKSEEEKYE